tara:strand:+ start:135 stop:446 length:312 start_codon:yes stop_codon:yes gene_type:complete
MDKIVMMNAKMLKERNKRRKEERGLRRKLEKEKMEKAISSCVDKIKAANSWDKVLTFPKVNGAVKVVAESGKFSFLVLADGEIHQLLETEEQGYEYFESLFED